MAREHDRLGALIAGAVGLAVACRWVSDLTAGERHGARYDVPAVNWLGWFASFVLAAVAVMLVTAGAARVLGRRRYRADGREPSVR